MDGADAKNQSYGGQGQRAEINLRDTIISRKAEKLEWQALCARQQANTAGWQGQQHQRLRPRKLASVQPLTRGIEGEESGPCIPREGRGAQPLLRRIQGMKPLGRPGPLLSRGVRLAGS